MNNGVQFGIEGPMMSGTWFNPTTGHKFTVRDCFFQDGQFTVQTMEGQLLDYNTIQNYVQVNDSEGHAMEPDSSLMAPQSKNIPQEVADILDLTPEDQAISKGLGNLNNRAIKVAEEPADMFVSLSSDEAADMQMIERVLRKHPAPDFEAQLTWQCPERQIDTLVNVLGVEPSYIADYYIRKLDKDAIFRNILDKLTTYIETNWGPEQTAASVVSLGTEEPVITPKKGPKSSKGNKKK